MCGNDARTFYVLRMLHKTFPPFDPNRWRCGDEIFQLKHTHDALLSLCQTEKKNKPNEGNDGVEGTSPTTTNNNRGIAVSDVDNIRAHSQFEILCSHWRMPKHAQISFVFHLRCGLCIVNDDVYVGNNLYDPVYDLMQIFLFPPRTSLTHTLNDVQFCTHCDALCVYWCEMPNWQKISSLQCSTTCMQWYTINWMADGFECISQRTFVECPVLVCPVGD